MDETKDVKFLLLEKLAYIEEVSRDIAKSYGYEDSDILSSSGILTYVYNGVTTISKIAKNLGISRQAVHKSVKALSNKGFLTLTKGEDKRERMICMTNEGKGLLRCRQDVMKKVEEDLLNSIGKENFLNLKKLLSISWQ
ncbi:MAG: MarR family transcriptional regulator [Sulfurospirillaceae bacterium]|nr:MarR family transcriptional regulator [Sulfurospirillaceae bacterium]MCK9545136.1 MarR family transcriptional regulator [Sulfurospirillaceae bacterium]NLM99200.1 MarR family transcriptional regulator [Campylobacteraceae bacterium]